MMLGISFLICTLVILYSGIKLSEYGDIIAEKTGLGRAWIGMVLLATVTSLPELVTGISSVTYADAPDIAIGDVLGSCVFNMLIISLLDALYPLGPISGKAQTGNLISAGFGILLLWIVSIGLILRGNLLSVGWIGPYSFLAIAIYFIAIRSVYKYEKRTFSKVIREIVEEHRDISLRKASVQFAINAFFIVVAAIFLPWIGKGIAENTGLGQTFVGNIFIALSTSLPEVVVSSSAVRLGAIDLAIGNLLGSNIFNIFILALDDFFYVKGPLLTFVSPEHLISALSGIAMTAVVIIGLAYRSERKAFFLYWDSVSLFIIYLVNLFLLYIKK